MTIWSQDDLGRLGGAAIDAEYARKYQGSMAAIAHINSPLARTTTMRVEPR